jgi:hypothetical protein
MDLLAEPLAGDHTVQLYQDEQSLVEAVTLYASAGLGKGDAVILLATPPHLDAVRRRLEDQGFDLGPLQEWRQLTVADAAGLLAELMVDGQPDSERFTGRIGGLIEQARGADRYPKVRVYGEMVNLIWRDDPTATRRLEELWNEVIAAHRISLFCAYCVDGAEEWRRFPRELRAAHSHVIPPAPVV